MHSDHNADPKLTAQDFADCCLNCRQSLEILKPHILDFHKRIEKTSHADLETWPPQALYATFAILDDIAHLDVGDQLANLLLAEQQIVALLPSIRSFYTRFFDLHERHLVRDVLAASDPWRVLRDFPLFSRYEALAAAHGRAAGFDPDTRIVFLGCGAIPLSAVLFASLFGVHTVGVDNDRNAVEAARQCVETFALQTHIKIVYGDETTLPQILSAEPPHAPDAILVAALAEPKKQIFTHLRRWVSDHPETQITYRTYTGLRAILYRPVQPSDVAGFRIVEIIEPTGRVNNTTVILNAV
jgi:hypothetical protein